VGSFGGLGLVILRVIVTGNWQNGFQVRILFMVIILHLTGALIFEVNLY
jgi:hypothetical protein